MPELCPADLADGGDAFRWHSQATASVVPSDLVFHKPKARDQRTGVAAGSGTGKLPDGLGVAPEAASGDSATRCRDRLSGEVEVDETYLGGRDAEIDGRGTDRALILIAAEVRGRGTGRVRMAKVRDASAASIIPFIQNAVREGAIIHTDGWAGYGPLPRHGYQHRPRSLRATGLPAHAAMPRIHRVASLLKRWWLGTYHGGISEAHLDHYLDEFTFRFNRRTSRARGLLFYRLVQQAVQMDALPYENLRSGGHNM